MLDRVLKEMGDVLPKVSIGIDNEYGVPLSRGDLSIMSGITSAKLPFTAYIQVQMNNKIPRQIVARYIVVVFL